MKTDSSRPTQKNQTPIQLLENRQLLGPVYLFIYGHQPLAFIGGQILHFVTPLLNVVAPAQNWHRWAERLSNAQRPDPAVRGKPETD